MTRCVKRILIGRRKRSYEKSEVNKEKSKEIKL